jgi:hypothetical protein
MSSYEHRQQLKSHHNAVKDIVIPPGNVLEGKR